MPTGRSHARAFDVPPSRGRGARDLSGSADGDRHERADAVPATTAGSQHTVDSSAALRLAGAALTIFAQRLFAWWQSRADELRTINHAAAAVNMLISSIENRAMHFPIVGYEAPALSRTLDFLLAPEAVEAVERFDDKFYWRLGNVEQHADLINLYVDLRNDSIRSARPCRAEIYRTLELLEGASKHKRYRFVRPFVRGSS